MKKYKIMINYHTGDSFNSYDEEQELGEWSDLDIVEKNLYRIQEHYEWYEETEKNYSYSPKKNLKKPDYVSDEYSFCLKLFADNGTEYQVSAFWCGYFEYLHSATVKMEMGFKRR